MKLRLHCLIVLAALQAISLSGAELSVYAAASLSDALKALAKPYEAASGDKLQFNFAASSTLARQIREGAPADVFFSADEAKMDDLEKADLVAAGTRKSVLSNSLVIVINAVNGADIAKPADLARASVRRIALAETQTVPAGIYAKAYLQKAGLWNEISSRIVPTENVRACLAAVEAGNADAGIVYKTDALISKKVKVACEIPQKETPEISYPLAVIKASKNAAAARRFAEYLTSAEAQTLFAQHGFVPAH